MVSYVLKSLNDRNVFLTFKEGLSFKLYLLIYMYHKQKKKIINEVYNEFSTLDFDITDAIQYYKS